MINLNLIKFNQNLTASINGKKRENYKKGDEILVNNQDLRYLQRLGCEVLGTKEVEYKDFKEHFDKMLELKKKKKEKVEVVEEQVED